MGPESSRGDARANASQPSDRQEGSVADIVADEALDWFARRRNAGPDAAEEAEFEAWRQRSSHHAEAYGDLEALWGSTAFAAAARSLPIGEPYRASDTKRRPARPKPAVPSAARRRNLRFGAVAALLMLAFGIWQAPTLLLRWQADYITAAGDRATIRLPDGSTLILNTASAVALDFESGRRDVRLLQGEAFFDVRHDPEHPFRVAGRFGVVEVKGTAFSVREDGSQDIVILERGHVAVSLVANKAAQAALEPDQQVIASADALSAVEPADPAMALAWRQGRIVFDDQPVSRVLAELRRYRSAPVVVASGLAEEFRVSGNYRTTDIDGALRSLAAAAGVSVTSLPGGILILH
ncbi:FecR family protein [Kaistia terrae]|uniref:FecR family protein n=1 Tax=Kaistia terrae TaxID=537017 RepID=A0ABW0PZI7_9HYPH|nr:FecR domain-containing protein [Kaistia terrae]MCX5580975.1 FecR domain-containing protein [Kaistia terrae]